jgi:O-antigen/teichoic acid export membrane protein
MTGCVVVVWTWGYGSPFRELWIAIAGLLVLGQLIRYLAMRCQADGRLGVLSFAELLWAVVSFAAMYLLVPYWGVLGVLIGMGAGFATAVVVACLQGIFPAPHELFAKEKPGASFRVFRELLSTGFPFMFVDGLFVVWQRIDRLVLVFLFGAESNQLGWYGLATMVASFAIQVPQIQMRVLFRRTLHAANQLPADGGFDPGRLRKHLEMPVMAVACTTPLLFGMGTALTWFLIRWFLPEYVAAEASVALLMLACYWSAVGISVRNLYTAMNRQWVLAVIYSVAILATVTVILGFSQSGGSGPGDDILVGGYGMLVGSVLFANFALWDTGRVCGLAFAERVRLLLIGWGPFALFALWTWVAGAFTASPVAQSGGASWMSLIGNVGTCLLIAGPMALTGLWKLTREK